MKMLPTSLKPRTALGWVHSGFMQPQVLRSEGRAELIFLRQKCNKTMIKKLLGREESI